jgi:hypothetical protein
MCVERGGGGGPEEASDEKQEEETEEETLTETVTKTEEGTVEETAEEDVNMNVRGYSNTVSKCYRPCRHRRGVLRRHTRRPPVRVGVHRPPGAYTRPLFSSTQAHSVG